MTQKKKNPERARGTQSGLNQRCFKDSLFGSDNQTNISVFARRLMLIRMLETGEPSVVEMTASTGLADPRSLIRRLRNNGINVSDYWASVNNRRLKKYFVKEVSYGG